MSPDGNFYCGKGRPFTAGLDDYQIVAAGSALRMGAEIYAPELENNASPMGNADFRVQDTGGGLGKYHIDVFVGEGPGLRSQKFNDSPSSLYTAFQNGRNGVRTFRDRDGVEKLGPLPLYQKSSVTWWPIDLCSTF